ncbi:myosin-3-like [Fundulus heteroclitus]|uniref:myosin-3-like n=1 Tax=Fundulus heteroclitus TaxID=8078 RepID=UPI00165B5039|nr:myosin-3-like [Fundulus heteroclitus]
MENDLKAARRDLEQIEQQPEQSEELKATQLELESKMSEIRDLREKLQEAKLHSEHKDETKDTTGGQKSKKNSTKMATPTQRMQDYQQSLKIILAMKRIYRLEDQINVSDTLQKTMENDLKAARKDLEKIDQQPEESEGLKATQLELESKMSEIRDLRKKLQEAKLHSEALAEKNRQKEAYLTEIKERYKQEFRKKIYEEQQWREEIDEEVEILKKKLEKKQSEVR